MAFCVWCDVVDTSACDKSRRSWSDKVLETTSQRCD